MYLITAFVSLNFLSFCVADDVFSILYLYNGNYTGLVAAYGDFNADKNIDIFSISNQGQNIDVWLAQKDGGFKLKPLTSSSGPTSQQSFISGLVVTDFNKDGFLDVLSLWKPLTTTKDTLLRVYWGSENALGDSYDFPGTYTGEPVLFDYNADMHADILTTDANSGEVKVWVSSGNASFTPTTFPSNLSINHPHSCAYLQILGSLDTDLVVTATNKKFQVFVDGDYTRSAQDYSISTTNSIGQSSFADMDEDLVVEHLLPVGNQIQVYSGGKWHLIANLEPEYSFDYSHVIDGGNDVKHPIPPTLVLGDYDNDGFPDILTVVKDVNGKNTAILLKNNPCDVSNNCIGFGRQLQVQESVLPPLPSHLTIHTASFFDYFEDGNLDIVLQTFSETSGKFQPVMLKNNIASDTCFMKVTVTSGMHEWPMADHKAYGVNSIGTTVMYETTRFGGQTQACISSQLTQSAHFSLQQPYVLFGLGQTPNFVDTVNITLPQRPRTSSRSRVWNQIIPNSQLIVNPYDLDKPSTWSMRLFVMPSKQIFTTTAVLGATCIFLTFVVGGLFIVEKREDKAVRSQESQRFHFDAM